MKIKILRRNNYTDCENCRKWKKKRVGENTVRPIKAQIIAWLGHIKRNWKSKVTRIIIKLKPTGVRIKWRQRNRWLEQVIKDLETIKVHNWSTKVYRIETCCYAPLDSFEAKQKAILWFSFNTLDLLDYLLRKFC